MTAPCPLCRYIIRLDPIQIYRLYPVKVFGRALLLSAAQSGKLVILQYYRT
jgi:hypothetical protein